MIVVDASLTLHATLPNPLQEPALERFENWIQEGQELLAPSLWLAECASGIRRAVHLRQVSFDSGMELLQSLEALTVQIYPIDLLLCESALTWSERLGQSRAYDSIYLALAERLSVEFWTADLRLASGARGLGLDWVRTN